jgi:serine-type D-Ala-D-Ala carboxypeptidase (penicillin-binding protein 5/6)
LNWITTAALVLVGLLPTGAVSRSLVSSLAPAPTQTASALASDYTPVAIPVKTGGTITPPAVSAASWYALDLTTGLLLGAKNADQQRPIASITKLATTLVILHDHELSDTLTLPKLPTYQADDEIIGLQAGERFTVHDLLAALLINSADDAADALALADSGSQTAFVAKMNQLVAQWGITGAHFSNPSGLIDTGNTVSAKAVAQIAELALRNQAVQQLVKTPQATIHDSAGRTFTLNTTDTLLQSGQFQGIKTGYTLAAGQCFVGLTTIQGHQVITVVLGSQDRFGDTTNLADWINQQYRWQAPPH